MNNPTVDRPFLIEHPAVDDKDGTSVSPARLVVTAQLRSSGLLGVLSSNQCRLLLAMLTFVTANGDVRATPAQLAAALRVSVPLMSLWLKRLEKARVLGLPLIHRVGGRNTPALYALSSFLIQHSVAAPADADKVVYRVADRQQVVEQSRAAYARPLSEVEPFVAAQLGHHPEEADNSPEGVVFRELRYLKIHHDDIRALIDAFGTDRILQQLEWLPLRQAKNPRRFLIAAIVGNYKPPTRLRDVLSDPRFGKRTAQGGETLPLPLGDEELGGGHE